MMDDRLYFEGKISPGKGSKYNYFNSNAAIDFEYKDFKLSQHQFHRYFVPSKLFHKPHAFAFGAAV